jgi:hypothetical protein
LKYGLQLRQEFYQSSSGTHHFLVLARGLEWKTKGADAAKLPEQGAKAEICRVPASMVLQSNFQKSDWDSQLACQLWDECNDKGSPLKAYVRLLLGSTTSTAAGDPCPDSVSPNALRHWSPAQRQLLASNTAGQGLLDLEERQELSWRKKYDQLFQHRNPIRGPSLSGP